MSRPRVTWKLLAACLIAAMLALMLAWRLHSRTVGPHWLLVSSPVLTNSDTVHPSVFLYVTNVGPRSLEFHVHWARWRPRTETPDSTNIFLLKPEGAAAKIGAIPYIALPAGAKRELKWELLPGNSVADPLCCFEIHWVADDSKFQSLYDSTLEPLLSKIGLVIGNPQWPSWRPKGAPRGFVFSSNLRPPGYALDDLAVYNQTSKPSDYIWQHEYLKAFDAAVSATNVTKFDLPQ